VLAHLVLSAAAFAATAAAVTADGAPSTPNETRSSDMTTADFDFAGLGLTTVQDPAQSLVERLRNAESAAIGEVYDEHHGAIRAFAKRLVGDPAAAEDLVHEVFVTLPRAIRRFRGDSSLRTFLISIAVNHARHHVRAASRRRAAMDRAAAEPTHAAAPDDPEQDARRRELAAVLTRALDQLPIDQRVAFVLCEVEERSSREAADVTGAPEATIRTRLFHAKRKLRATLEKEGLA
jgi:RNA polymerase sigma-70 factor (ECF subfamily)